jgi:hypothetical protein
VTQAEALACSSEGKGLIAGAVVGHHTLHLDAKAFVIGERGPEEGDRAALLLVEHHLGKGNARVIVDADVQVFPARPLTASSCVALASTITGDAMADLIEPSKLFDIDVDQFAWAFTLVASDGFGRFEST